MKTKRYTESQILCGLRRAWLNDTASIVPVERDSPIIPLKEIDDWVQEVDLGDVINNLEDFFCFTASHEEWFELFGDEFARRDYQMWKNDFMPRLTFGALARFIAERAPVAASFEPITVLGSPCKTAGVFMGMRRVAQIAKKRRAHFPPSARLLDVLRGRDLHTFWVHLNWMTEDALPELPWFWCSLTHRVVGLGCLTLLAASLVAIYNPLLSIAALPLVVACYISARAYQYFANPLPEHIVTFRDLAMEIAKAHQARRI